MQQRFQFCVYQNALKSAPEQNTDTLYDHFTSAFIRNTPVIYRANVNNAIVDPTMAMMKHYVVNMLYIIILIL